MILNEDPTKPVPHAEFDSGSNAILLSLTHSNFQQFQALTSFDLESYSDIQQYWLDCDDILKLIEMVPRSVKQCRIHS
jgi:hypothetical protein